MHHCILAVMRMLNQGRNKYLRILKYQGLIVAAQRSSITSGNIPGQLDSPMAPGAGPHGGL